MTVIPLHDRINDRDSDAPPKRLAGLDRVRALAALGVVLLHACVPYLRHPMPGLTWPIRDTTSATVDWLFWSIEVFIMPVFLIVGRLVSSTNPVSASIATGSS